MLVYVLCGAAACVVAVGFYTYQRISALPALRPETYLANKSREQRGRVVVCAGASIVHGSVSQNVVTPLSKLFPSFLFVNAGVNGDLAYSVLQVLFVSLLHSHAVY